MAGGLRVHLLPTGNVSHLVPGKCPLALPDDRPSNTAKSSSSLLPKQQPGLSKGIISSHLAGHRYLSYQCTGHIRSLGKLHTRALLTSGDPDIVCECKQFIWDVTLETLAGSEEVNRKRRSR